MTDKWKSLKTAPKNGMPLVFWLSGINGLPDTTATFFYATPGRAMKKDFIKAFPEGKGWYSEETGRKLTRAAIVKGWLPCSLIKTTPAVLRSVA